MQLLAETAEQLHALRGIAVAGIQTGWVYYLDVDTYLSAERYQEQRHEERDERPARQRVLRAPMQATPPHADQQ